MPEWSESPRPADATGVLVGRARDGDRDALEALIERYWKRVERVVRRRMGPGLRRWTESGDVVQDAMIATFRGIGSFEPRDEGAFFRWLTGVVENRLRNLAAEQERRTPRGGTPSQLDLAGDASEPGTGLDRQRERALLAGALEQLDPDYRRVIELRHYGRLSFAEVGAALGRTENAAWMLHRRATVQLARHMNTMRREAR